MDNPDTTQPLPSSGFNEILKTKETKYNKKAAVGLGITQMIIGLISLTIFIVLISNQQTPAFTILGYGAWGGIVIFTAGFLQVLSAKKIENNTCVGPTMMAGTVVMNLFANMASMIIAIFSICDSLSHFLGTIYRPLFYTMAILAIIELFISAISAVRCFNFLRKQSSPNVQRNTAYENQPVPFQTNPPGLALPSYQRQFSVQRCPPQMQLNPSQQVPSNPGLSSTPPPHYDVACRNLENSQQPSKLEEIMEETDIV